MGAAGELAPRWAMRRRGRQASPEAGAFNSCFRALRDLQRQRHEQQVCDGGD